MADLDAIRHTAWALKTAPRCTAPCPGDKPNGICTCGALTHWLAAHSAFTRLMTPDVALELVDLAEKVSRG